MAYIPPVFEGASVTVSPKTVERLNKSAAAFIKMRDTKGLNKAAGACDSLARTYHADALAKWFCSGEHACALESVYLSSKLTILGHHLNPANPMGCPANSQELVYPLLINDQPMIHWHAQFLLPFFGAKSKGKFEFELPYRFHHLSMQGRLALQKDWALVGQRSDDALAIEPKKNKLYRADYRYFKALAMGDEAAMLEAIEELLSPQVGRHRNRDMGWEREQYMFSGWAVLYLQLARYSGYSLTVDNPWVPKEWLSDLNLVKVPESFDFIDNFDIFTPFNDEYGLAWCENPSRFSPRRLGEKPLTFADLYASFGA